MPPKSPPTEFGYTLKILREKRGVSQSKLAEKAEFDHSYVSRLESGAREPTREAVLRLGEALRVSDDELNGMLISSNFLPKTTLGLIQNLAELKDLDDALSTANETDRLSVTFTVRLLIDFLHRGQ